MRTGFYYTESVEILLIVASKSSADWPVLESRVERLEEKIADARARRKSSSVHMLDTDTPVASATPRRTSVDTVKAPKQISKRAARRKEASDIDELVSDFGLLYVLTPNIPYHCGLLFNALRL